jgi:hypothetical protein
VIYLTILVIIQTAKTPSLLAIHRRCLILLAAKAYTTNTTNIRPDLDVSCKYHTQTCIADSAVKNEEGPFLKLQSLLLAYWTEVCQDLEDKIKKLSIHLVFFCNLTSVLSCEPDVLKVKLRIRGFLQGKRMAVTAVGKLLSPS